MRSILITGANSYVGTRLSVWLKKYPHGYSTDSVSLRGPSWQEIDFSGYEVVLHVAGVAHIRETKRNADLYYRVNRDLAYNVAKKAKYDGVKQFIFLSSMSVYGVDTGTINENSIPCPVTHYGKSKFQAECLINTLSDEKFRISIVRAPMVYGEGCKGNYRRLSRFVLRTPAFPNIKNKRSMLYIDNLCEFIRLLIDDGSSGVFFPQNAQFVSTCEMAQLIAQAHNKKVWVTGLFNPLLDMLNLAIVKKLFGDLVYDMAISEYSSNYRLYDLNDSIYLSEKGPDRC